MNNPRIRCRKAFTLVELLIVILIIGILSGALLLTMSKARVAAEAARIVEELGAIKAAATMSYHDHGADWITHSRDIKDHVNDYLDKDLVGGNKPPRYYTISIGRTLCYFPDDDTPKDYAVSIAFVVEMDDKTGLREKLADMAEEMRFYRGYGCDRDEFFTTGSESNKWIYYPIMYSPKQ